MGAYGEALASASHMNPHDLNMNMHHDDYSLKWRFGGNSVSDGFDRLHHHPLKQRHCGRPRGRIVTPISI